MLLVGILLVVLSALTAYSSGCDYQRLESGHTMCVYPARNCPGKSLIRSGGVTCQDKKIILETHNRLRQMLALGKVRGQPPSLDMRELVWDEELAIIAQRWADQCNSGHDRHRRVERFSVGQNVATTWTYDRPSPVGEEPEFKRQIEAWFNEVTQIGFRPQDIDPFTFNWQAGHYTQMAWSETHAVGCGYTYFRDPLRGFTKLYVCNYGPGGNIIGASMYRIGRPGQTMCINEGLATSRRYPGLCELLSGVDYRESVCYSTAASAAAALPTVPSSGAIDQALQPLGSLTGGTAIAPVPASTPPILQLPSPQPPPSHAPAPVNDILKSLQTSLAKLLNPYNLFG